MPILGRKTSTFFRTRASSAPVPACDTAPPVPPIPAQNLEKPHITRALKYLDNDADRKRALEIAEEWRMKFASDEWNSAREVISKAKRGILPPEESKVLKREPREIRTSRGWTEDPRRRTEYVARTGENPRPQCWPGEEEDKVEVSCFRPWPRPQARDNAFAQKGFWSEEKFESTRALPSTSLPLLPPASSSPKRPPESNRPKDTDSRLAYDLITSSIATCDSTEILERYRIDSSIIPDDLPEILAHYVDKENETMEEYTIWEPFERIGIIPCNPEEESDAERCVVELTERRKMLQMMRPLKGSVLELSKEEFRAAWAVCIVERLEREKAEKRKREKEEREKAGKKEEKRRKGIQIGDDDEYDYGNFLRSMQQQGSAAYPGAQSAGSRSMSASTAETSLSIIRPRSLRNDSASMSSQSGRMAATTPRSSTSTANSSPPKSLYRSLTYDAPPTPEIPIAHRSNTSSMSSHGTPVTVTADSLPSTSPHYNLPKTVVKIDKSSDALQQAKRVIRPPLSILTKHLSKAGKSEASPAQKEERRRGPHMNDLITWAEELKSLRRQGSVSSSGSIRTVIKDGTVREVQETAETADEVREETDVGDEARGEDVIQLIPLPPPSAVFPSSYWPSSGGSRSVESAFRSSSLSESRDRCSKAEDYFVAAVNKSTTQTRNISRRGGSEEINPDDRARPEEDARKKQRDTAEREWAAEMQRMEDREFARQARERESRSREFEIE